jgi:predicted ATPase with chaperone activity
MSTDTAHAPASGSLLAKLLADDSTFHPAEPRTIEETGLSASAIESLIVKYLMLVGSSTGRKISETICLPFGLIEPLFQSLRQRQLLVYSGNTSLNDYMYTLTDQGRVRAKSYMDACAYVGPAPVPLPDYINSVDAQSIRAEAPKRKQLEKAFADITVESDMFETLGPAVNSGSGLFLYGAPGNGKTTLAKRITACYGSDIWIPHALVEDGQYIKLFDAAFHEPMNKKSGSILKDAEHDQRWIRVRRPTVIVGGELTLDSLEIRHDPHNNVSEAPLQLKSNCGCLLIDDFGRQRVSPTDLLNRWIVPLESRIDFLSLSTGKKITVPFEQLIIFSTNLEPSSLADEAFLRRIPYKIECRDPSPTEFHKLFRAMAKSFRCDYKPEAVDYLVEKHYKPFKRPLRRCQPRDLLSQVANYCSYNELPMEMRSEYFDRVVPGYFTVVKGT